MQVMTKKYKQWGSKKWRWNEERDTIGMSSSVVFFFSSKKLEVSGSF